MNGSTGLKGPLTFLPSTTATSEAETCRLRSINVHVRPPPWYYGYLKGGSPF